MKITSRCFVFALLCLLAILPAFPQAPNQKFLVFVGTYTDKTDSKGIYAYEFDASTGKLSPKGLAAETSNPSWVVVHPNGKWAYAANESGKQSAISAFSVDAKSAKLTLLNKLPAVGEDPCYLSFDKTGKYLFVANYTSGNVVVFPILPDGKLGDHTAAVQDAGTLGPNKERQEAPHAHWVGARGNEVFVADLGLDRVLLYGFDPAKGTLRKAPGPNAKHPFFSSDLKLSSGTGPRHVAFSSTENGHDVTYVVGELDSTVSLFAPTIEGGYSGLPGQKITMLPTEFSDRNDAAEITVHPSGKWLFASNRGHDSIAVFSVDPATGILKRAGDYSTGGKEPRHFAIDPTGQFLLAENQNSNSIVVFRIDPATGALSQISITEGIPSPVCLTFLRTP
jgi:6-phosphogluconolactonase